MPDFRRDEEPWPVPLQTVLESQGRPTLLVVEVREPENKRQVLEPRPWLAALEPEAKEIRLAPLGSPDMEVMARQLLAPQFPEQAVRKLVAVSGGIALCLIEAVRSLLEEGRLRYTSRGWCLHPGRWSDWKPPLSLASAFESRLRVLDPESRKLIGLLAILEVPTGLEPLAQLSGINQEEAQEQLVSLEERGLVLLSGSLQEVVAGLPHSWIRDSLNLVMEEEEKGALSKRICRCLTDPDTCGMLSLERRARLALASNDTGLIRLHFDTAVKELFVAGRWHEVLRMLERADASLQGDLFPLLRANCLFKVGRFRECAELLDGFAGSDPVAAREALTLVSRCRLALGDWAGAAISLDRAAGLIPSGLDGLVADRLRCLSAGSVLGVDISRLARQLLSSPVTPLSALALAEFHEAFGHPEEARGWLVRGTRTAVRERDSLLLSERDRVLSPASDGPEREAEEEEEGDRELLNECLLGLAIADIRNGIPNHSRRALQNLLSSAASEGNPELLSRVQLAEADFCRICGGNREAIQLLEKVTERNQRANCSPLIEYHARLVESHCHLDRWALDKAAVTIESARELARSLNSRMADAELSLAEARLALFLGRSGDARRLVNAVLDDRKPSLRAEAIQLAIRAALIDDMQESVGQLISIGRRLFGTFPAPWKAEFRSLQSEVALARGLKQLAASYSALAMRLARNLEMPPLLARAFEVHARSLSGIEPSRARAFALRSLRIARKIAQPLLAWRALITLGGNAASNGEGIQAEEHYIDCLSVLKPVTACLAEVHRESFHRVYQQPCEAGLETIRKSRFPRLPKTISCFFEISEDFKRAESLEDIASALVGRVVTQLNAIGARFYAVTAARDYRSVKSVGATRFDPLALLKSSQGGNGHDLVFRQEKKVLSVALPFHDPVGLTGWLYLERVGEALPEAEFEFLHSLRSAAELALRVIHAPVERTVVRQAPVNESSFRSLVGNHPLMIELQSLIIRFGSTQSTVLITGESGTGKELVARALHDLSPSRAGPFVAVNCAGFSPDLVESQLFGHARGAFTGATETRMGFFEAANKGTLFLDEIGTMPIELQSRLLRVLELRTFTRLGETAERPMRARILAATNQNLREMVACGRFRADLYHRLNVLRIQVPPLRERKSDIPLLCRYFLEKLAQREGIAARLDSEALSALGDYPFPGNVRELEHMLESLVIRNRTGLIRAHSVAELIGASSGFPDSQLEADDAWRISEMESGRMDFWTAVRDPFLERTLSRRDVRRIIGIGLARREGSYRRLACLFGLPDCEYKRFMNFLDNHDCKVDFRPFRRQNGGGKRKESVE